MAKIVAGVCLAMVCGGSALSWADSPWTEQAVANRLANEVILASATDQSQPLDPATMPLPSVQTPPGAPAAPTTGSAAPGSAMSGSPMPNAAAPSGMANPNYPPNVWANPALNGIAYPGANCPQCSGPTACPAQFAQYNPCPCGDCCMCGPPGTFWVRDEYVGWWINGGHLPPLVATNPNGTLPSNTTLFGDDTYNGDYRPGVWTDVGMWLDCCHVWGVEFDYFYVGRETTSFFANSDGDPILTRPFIDATTGLPSEQLVAVPGTVVGSIGVDYSNFMSSAGFDFRRNLCCSCNNCCDPSCYGNRPVCGGGLFRSVEGSRLDFLIGFRYYGFDDDLSVREQLTSIATGSGIPIGTQFGITDSFETQNNFYGVELGLDHHLYRGSFIFEGIAKVAIGGTQERVKINGQTIVSFPGQPTAINEGGLLALSSNIGNYTQDRFAAVPLISARVGYRLTERLTFNAGYTFIYMGQVVRAGDQIDTTVNPNLIPPSTNTGPERPAFAFNQSRLWLQGITLGLDYSF